MTVRIEQHRLLLLVTNFLLALAAIPQASAQQCSGLQFLRSMSVPNGIAGTVRAVAVTGSGEVFAGGSFDNASGTACSNLAMWDGARWSSVGGGTNGEVHSLILLGDGSLLAGGTFTSAGGVACGNIARWNGQRWTSVDRGVNGDVAAMAVLPNGAIVFGGTFSAAGAVACSNIATWDGARWSPLGQGINGRVAAMQINTAGKLVVAGDFSHAGGVLRNNIAEWDGQSWSSLGSGLSGPVTCLAALSNGTLLVGGQFESDDYNWHGRFAVWTENSGWIRQNLVCPECSSTLTAMLQLADGTVVAGGSFDHYVNWFDGPLMRTGGAPDNSGYVTFDPLQTGLLSRFDQVLTMAKSPSGGFIAGGDLRSSQLDISAGQYVGKVEGVTGFDGTSGFALSNRVEVTTAIWPMANEELLIAGLLANGQYAVGRLSSLPGNTLSFWHQVGTTMNGPIAAICTFEDGRMVASGGFTTVGSTAVNRIAVSDGASWQPLGAGVNGDIQAMLPLTDGSLVVGGTFSIAGFVQASNVARWTGNQWMALGSGLNGPVRSFVQLSDGSLIAGGDFLFSGSTACSRIARWDGSRWTSLGGGTDGTVYSLAVAADGKLLAAGDFAIAGEVPCQNLAQWDGQRWAAVAPGRNSSIRRLLALPNGHMIAFDATLAYYWNGMTWWGWPFDPICLFHHGAVLSNSEIVLARRQGSGLGCGPARSVDPQYVIFGVEFQPAILEQPRSQVTCLGGVVSFDVVPSPSVQYLQWRKNGTPIPGATSPTLTIASVTAADAGVYDCVATNACGTATTNAASLTVNPSTVVVTHPLPQNVAAGATASFSVAATGASGLTFQWRRNGVALLNGTRIAGATTPTLTITGARADDQGSFDCLVTGGCGAVASNPASLVVSTCPTGWLAATPAPFGVRSVHGQAYSGVNGGTLVFGGTGPTSNASWGDTWLFAGGRWTQVSTTGPAARSYVAMAPLPNGRVLLFGGQTVVNAVSSSQGDTWEWDGTAWNLLNVSGPSPRAGHTMALDTARGRVVLFGGLDAASAYLRDTWEWNGTSWTRVATTGPSGNFGHASAFDPVRGETLIFGGAGTGSAQTWAWNGTSWRQAATSGVSVRNYPAMAFDESLGRVLLFGGFAGGADVMGDSYLWTGSAWSPSGIGSAPGPRWKHGLSYDRAAGGLVITAGTGYGQLPLADSSVLSPLPQPTSQPTDASTASGGTAQFTFGVSGGAVSYRWHRNGTPLFDGGTISGGAYPTLTISPVGAADQGTYQCITTGPCGGVTSRSVTLSCRPTISVQPQGGTFVGGQQVTLQVVATAGTGASYRWRKDGVNLFNGPVHSGVTTSTLTINAYEPSQSGAYSLVITNPCGSVTSDAAVVDVTCPADFNNDGGTDGQDLFEFFEAWAGGLSSADLNFDGGTDGSDVTAFFTRWESGC